MPRIAPIPYEALSPEAKGMIDEGLREGFYDNGSHQPPPSMRTVAYSLYALRGEHALMREMWRDGLLEPRLKELVRIRSAQINGCQNCASAIKDPDVSSEDVQCMIDLDGSRFSPREAAALRFVRKFAVSHHDIDDEDFRKLTEFFSVAEIVELGYYAAMNFGMHKIMSLFQVVNPREPLFAFDPARVNSRALESQLHEPAA
jgi:hypothetical protein